MEVYEFVHNIPDRYFAYVRLWPTSKLGIPEDRYGEVTTWTGDKLGGIAKLGRAYRSNLGDWRVNMTVRAINGKTYFGTYYKSAGDYCRLRIARNAGKFGK